MQRIAFGQPPLDAAAEESVSAETPERTLLGKVDGEVVSAGGWSAVVEGVSEIVGVATAERFRRRGLAAALTAAAAQAAFDEGAEVCVLSPGDESAMRVYERVGIACAASAAFQRLLPSPCRGRRCRDRPSPRQAAAACA